MRIISFTQMWDKLQKPEFTTFRYPRLDRDWYVGETVQVFYKNRSPTRVKLGTAQILGKERQELNSHFKEYAPFVTDEEVKADGFNGWAEMEAFMIKQYGLDYISLFNKLTLTWISK